MMLYMKRYCVSRMNKVSFKTERERYSYVHIYTYIYIHIYIYTYIYDIYIYIQHEVLTFSLDPFMMPLMMLLNQKFKYS